MAGRAQTPNIAYHTTHVMPDGTVRFAELQAGRNPTRRQFAAQHNLLRLPRRVHFATKLTRQQSYAQHTRNKLAQRRKTPRPKRSNTVSQPQKQPVDYNQDVLTVDDFLAGFG